MTFASLPSDSGRFVVLVVTLGSALMCATVLRLTIEADAQNAPANTSSGSASNTTNTITIELKPHDRKYGDMSGIARLSDDGSGASLSIMVQNDNAYAALKKYYVNVTNLTPESVAISENETAKYARNAYIYHVPTCADVTKDATFTYSAINSGKLAAGTSIRLSRDRVCEGQVQESTRFSCTPPKAQSLENGRYVIGVEGTNGSVAACGAIPNLKNTFTTQQGGGGSYGQVRKSVAETDGAKSTAPSRFDRAALFGIDSGQVFSYSMGAFGVDLPPTVRARFLSGMAEFFGIHDTQKINAAIDQRKSSIPLNEIIGDRDAKLDAADRAGYDLGGAAAGLWSAAKSPVDYGVSQAYPSIQILQGLLINHFVPVAYQPFIKNILSCNYDKSCVESSSNELRSAILKRAQ